MAFRLGIFGVLIAALIGVMVFAYSILNPAQAGGGPGRRRLRRPPPTVADPHRGWPIDQAAA